MRQKQQPSFDKGVKLIGLPFEKNSANLLTTGRKCGILIP